LYYIKLLWTKVQLTYFIFLIHKILLVFTNPKTESCKFRVLCLFYISLITCKFRRIHTVFYSLKNHWYCNLNSGKSYIPNLVLIENRHRLYLQPFYYGGCVDQLQKEQFKCFTSIIFRVLLSILNEALPLTRRLELINIKDKLLFYHRLLKL
jgi:hypothetical protein